MSKKGSRASGIQRAILERTVFARHLALDLEDVRGVVTAARHSRLNAEVMELDARRQFDMGRIDTASRESESAKADRRAQARSALELLRRVRDLVAIAVEGLDLVGDERRYGLTNDERNDLVLLVGSDDDVGEVAF